MTDFKVGDQVELILHPGRRGIITFVHENPSSWLACDVLPDGFGRTVFCLPTELRLVGVLDLLAEI